MEERIAVVSRFKVIRLAEEITGINAIMCEYVLRLILEDQLLKVDNDAVVGWGRDHREAVDIGRIRVRKSRAGDTNFCSVTCQVDGFIAINHPLVKVGLRRT